MTKDGDLKNICKEHRSHRSGRAEDSEKVPEGIGNNHISKATGEIVINKAGQTREYRVKRELEFTEHHQGQGQTLYSHHLLWSWPLSVIPTVHTKDLRILVPTATDQRLYSSRRNQESS